MKEAADVIGAMVAALTVAAIMLSAVRTIVLPRAVNSRIARLTTRFVLISLNLRAGRASSYDTRDATMAMLAPMALMSMLMAWLLLLYLAFTGLFFATTGRSLTNSAELSGSSIVTLGTTTAPGVGTSLLTYAEAALGLLLVALFITYFPSIYAAFTRRESGVTLLQSRAGTPPHATTMLIRFHRIEETVGHLRELWGKWEEWFADIEESHTSFQILAFFRSPQADRSWVTAAGTVLDAAALWVACVEHEPDPDAQLCLRSGFLALRRIAEAFRIPFDPDPTPEGPISISRHEWDRAMSQMEAAGMTLISDREAAWTAWRGWRVNYDTTLLRLARLTEAPPAEWTSDRSPVAFSAASARRASASRRWPRRSPAPPG